MEIISFFIGIFLGIISLSMNRIILLFKIILSIGTSYIYLLMVHPTFKIWNLKDLKWENVFFNFHYKYESIAAFIISFLIFYTIFPIIINSVFTKKIRKRYNSFFFNINEYRARSLKLFCHKIVKLSINIRLKLGFRFSKKPEKENIIEYWDDLIRMVSIIIHFLICWIFILGFPSILISSLMFLILFILMFNVVAIPFSKNLFSYIDNVFNHELNRHFKSISG